MYKASLKLSRNRVNYYYHTNNTKYYKGNGRIA